MGNEVIINGVAYVPKEIHEGERLVIVIIDNRGLTYVGYSDLKPDEFGFIRIREAQCVVKWFTGAHLNYLVNGICEDVSLGAPADILVTHIIQAIYLPFNTIDEWKSSKTGKGQLEMF